MGYKFNFQTGKLDYFEDQVAGGITFLKVPQVVDANFLLTPDIDLGVAPAANSEVVTLNGLEIDSSNYSIAGSTLTMVVTQLKVGDNIYINFAS